MARKAQENPALDMTPMIDVVFELIIFFVVTLQEAANKDETIELEDGQHGMVLKAEDLPKVNLQIDIGIRDELGRKRKKPRITMSGREKSPAEIGQLVKTMYKKIGEFPVMIRADFECPHSAVAEVMNACTANGIWKISFLAVGEDHTSNPKGSYSARPHLGKLIKKGN